MTVMPMFPLGMVLLPGMPLQLRIFEMRYQQMLSDVLSADGEFGVVLIERGNEVGGADTRTNVGTVARITHHQDLGRGRHAIAAVGTERFMVNEWLLDDPYPLAEISSWPDILVTDADLNYIEDLPQSGETQSNGDTKLMDLYQTCADELSTLLATANKLGYNVAPEGFEIPKDESVGSYFLSTLAPLGPFDKQILLSARSTKDRLTMLRELVEDQLSVLLAMPDNS